MVDKKKYRKKTTKSQYELLNLKASCSLLIKNNETPMNSSKCRLKAKFPIINDRGKVKNNISTNFVLFNF